MAHAFDNRKKPSELGERFYSNNSPIYPKHDEQSADLWENSSGKSNHFPPSYEDTISNQHLSSNDSSFRQRQQAVITADYLAYTRRNSPIEDKPPPPLRSARMTSTTNNNYIRRSNFNSSQYQTNGYKTNTKYFSATQLYINQPADEKADHPPPPPPRCPINPSRYPLHSTQTNSVTIPDFNSSTSPQTIYRSSPSTEFNQIEQQLPLLSLDETSNESIVGETFGNCCKCGEIITSLDDPCDVLGQIYHGFCAICFICKKSVKNKHFYIQEHLYCEEDFRKLSSNQSTEHCVVCQRAINDTIIQALGESYHLACFQCSKCFISLDGRPFLRDKKRNLFCLRDYYITYGLKCDKCKKTIYPENGSNETVRIVSMGKNFHVKCYQCEDCSKQLGEEQDCLCYPVDDALLCQDCYHRRLVYINKF